MGMSHFTLYRTHNGYHGYHTLWLPWLPWLQCSRRYIGCHDLLAFLLHFIAPFVIYFVRERVGKASPNSAELFVKPPLKYLTNFGNDVFDIFY